MVKENEQMDEEAINTNERDTRRFYDLAPNAIITYPRDNEPQIMRIPINQMQFEATRLIAEQIPQPVNPRSTLNENLYAVILAQLLKPNTWTPPAPGTPFPIKKPVVERLCEEVIKLLQQTDTVLKLRPPIKIFGSIHGQYGDLMRHFATHGAPLDSTECQSDIEGLDYLFLGNFVGRGKYSLETVCLLFALKLKYPDQIHILRGCMEDIRLSKVYGLADECEARFNESSADPNSLFQKINRVFEYLPLAATVVNKVFCVSSGVGSTVGTIDEINKIKRPLTINYESQTRESKIVLDLLWSDPVLSNGQGDTRANDDRDQISQGQIVRFSNDRVRSFMYKNNLQLIIRSHECVIDGVENLEGSDLWTVFSCTEYGGKYMNHGGMILIKKNREVVAKYIDCIKGNTEWVQMTNRNLIFHTRQSEDENELRNRPITPPRGIPRR